MPKTINAKAIAKMLGGEVENYSTAIRRHMEIISDLKENPPAHSFRGETTAERSKRQYWQKKIGQRWKPIDFIFSYPMLAKNQDACFKSRRAVEREYFSPSAKKRQLENRAKYRRPRDKALKSLATSEMIRVEMLAGDFKSRSGFITALHPEKGYRVTLWPNERWKNKVRRWCHAGDFSIIGGRKLPDLPSIDAG
jgi:hypothetical protein